ncbi:BTAD domain-containing putative transcriptional regulator [Nocardia sp. XZ_19_385]|uniref:AfsR/SARP family transcriptional regulator n=1 Tax=Nocardia sp. XZ_19_385 TaxID=2769488 RepID=UPI0028168A55|nr:BTAD domain-containing putative transcriptional regulator [Nocardia sp. XZ_19_385]
MTTNLAGQTDTLGGSSRLRFAVLGEVRAWYAGAEIDLGPRQRRALIAALLLRRGRTATITELVEGIWGPTPTSSAIGAVRNHVLHLRRALEPQRDAGDAPQVLVSFGGGYALRLEHGVADVDHVEAYLARERVELTGVEAIEAARERLDAILGLWSGTPLAGLPGPFAERARAQLVERRIALLEQRIELDLRLGRYQEAISELGPISVEYPLREQTRALLMTALYHTGRQAEALAVYAETRRVLVEQIGIEPGPQLAALHHRMLSGDLPAPVSAATKAPMVRGPRISRTPAQLPSDIPDFTGRAETVRQIGAWLTRADAKAVPVCAIGGMAGIGKSALAVHVAHAVRDRFPDGQLHVDMSGFAEPVPPIDLLGDFLRALGVPEGEIAGTLAERSAQFRSCLDNKRVLVVLDNARDADQVAPLIPGTSGSAVLVTSRSVIVELPGMLSVRLAVLDPDETRELLHAIVGGPRVMAEPTAVDDLISACSGLPLAVRILGSRLLARPRWTVASLAERLADHQRRLSVLRAGDLAVAAAFQLSFDQLDAEQARAFSVLSIPDVGEISLDCAAAVLGADRGTAEDLLESLVDLSLIEATGPGRYSYHDLLRLYGRGVPPTEPGESANGPVLRLLDFYLAAVKNAVAVCNPGTRLPTYLRPTTSSGLSFTDTHTAQAWLESERPNLVPLYQQAARLGGPALVTAAEIAWATAELIDGGPNSQEVARALEQLLDAALRVRDRAVECRIRVALGAILAHALGSSTQGREHQRIALSLGRESGPEARLTAFAAQLLAASTRAGADTAAPLAHGERAIGWARQLGDRALECTALVHIVKTLSDAGRFEEAEARARAARALALEIGNRGLTAMATQELGVTMAYLGRYQAALDSSQEAVRLARSSGLVMREGLALARLAHTNLLAGRPEIAEPIAAEAVRVLARVAGAAHRATVLVLQGIVLRVLDRDDEAQQTLRSAADIFGSMDDPQCTRERLYSDVEAPVILLLRERLDERV